MNPADPETHMTQVEYAAHRGVGKSAVSNWKAAGLLVFAELDGKNLVDVAATDEILDAQLDPTRGRPASAIGDGPSGAPTRSAASELGAVRLEFIREQTTRKRMENDRYAGDLVARVEVEAAAADWARRARERMQGVARQLAERLGMTTEPRQILALLSAEIDTAFDGLAMEAEADAALDLVVAPELELADDRLALEA